MVEGIHWSSFVLALIVVRGRIIFLVEARTRTVRDRAHFAILRWGNYPSTADHACRDISLVVHDGLIDIPHVRFQRHRDEVGERVFGKFADLARESKRPRRINRDHL